MSSTRSGPVCSVVHEVDTQTVLALVPPSQATQMSEQPMTQIHRLDRSPRGRRALRHLLASPSSGAAGDPDVVIDARGVVAMDAFTGAMVVANAQHHLGRTPDVEVAIEAPESGEVLGRFCTMLALKPDRSRLHLPGGRTAPVRDPRVLVPAVRVSSVEEAEGLALFVRSTSQATHLADARLDPHEAGFLATALPTLVENSLMHAPDSSCGTIVCAALEAENKEVQLVVTDLGTSVSRSPKSLDRLRGAWAQSRRELGGLFLTTELARRRGLDVSMQVLSGRAASRWRGGFHSDEGEYVRGWTAALTVHR